MQMSQVGQVATCIKKSHSLNQMGRLLLNSNPVWPNKKHAQKHDFFYTKYLSISFLLLP